MIGPLDLTADVVVRRVVEIQRAAYALEAELIGSRNIPPLNESESDVAELDLEWLCWSDGEQILGVIAWTDDGEALDIDRLAVDPAHARRGIGLTLVNSLPNRRLTTVSTGLANARARALYEALGFDAVATDRPTPGVEVVHFERRLGFVSMGDRPTKSVVTVLVDTLDDVHAQLIDRCQGLTEAEYLWEPTKECWTVRSTGDGAWIVDHERPEPVPAPITTIAWRLWHIAIDCFEGYSSQSWGSSGTQMKGQQWVGSPPEALELTTAAYRCFRSGVVGAGDTGIWDQLGPDWGPWQRHSMVDLVLHAQHELAHHSGEIGLLRDLYRSGLAERGG